MHRYPSALIHLEALRDAAGRSEDLEVRQVAGDLVDRLEMAYHLRTLSKASMLVALDAFRGFPGTAESISALSAMAGPGAPARPAPP